MDFLTKLCGSVPGDPEMVAKWVETRLKRKKVRAPDSMSIDEIAQEVLSSLPEEEEQAGLLVFQRQEGGLVVRLATVRAHFKDCADKVSRYYVGKVEGESSFKAKVINCVYYDPRIYWLPILSQESNKLVTEVTGAYEKREELDNPITEASGAYDKPVHAQTPRGPISALKRIEYVENARLKVPVWILSSKASDKPVISETDLEHLLEYGGVHGYAGERSDGEGRYVATIRRLEK